MRKHYLNVFANKKFTNDGDDYFNLGANIRELNKDCQQTLQDMNLQLQRHFTIPGKSADQRQ